MADTQKIAMAATSSCGNNASARKRNFLLAVSCWSLAVHSPTASALQGMGSPPRLVGRSTASAGQSAGFPFTKAARALFGRGGGGNGGLRSSWSRPTSAPFDVLLAGGRSGASRCKLFASPTPTPGFGSDESPSSHSVSRKQLVPTIALSATNGEAEAAPVVADSEVDAETKLVFLRQENDVLRDQIAELEKENARLAATHVVSPDQIVIERFEGENLPLFDARGQEVKPWYDDDEEDDKRGEPNAEKAAAQQKAAATVAAAALAATAAAREEYTSLNGAGADMIGESCDEYDGLTCPIEPDVTFGDALRDRAYWLCGLLAMQSLSGFILSRNEILLQNHPVIVYFLTMLVGAGGNAGNQASVRVIRGLALGTLNERTQRQFLNREFKMALCLCGLLSAAGFVRAAAFRTPLPETIAITASLALIVMSSICLGAVLPLVLQKLRVDPAHSSTTIQVIMDILGVVMTVAVSTAMLDSPFGQFILSKLS